MDDQAIFIYFLCDETLKSQKFTDDKQCKMSSAEIMTFSIISALHFQCNYRKTRMIVKMLGYFSKTLSYSRLTRRIHEIPSSIWWRVFYICKELLGVRNEKEHIIDSFPVPVCQNNKIFRCRLLLGKEYHGYCASKKAYFFGIKVHMITTEKGIPVEFYFTPGSENDVKALKHFECDFPEGSIILGDKAYNDYLQEDLLYEGSGIKLLPRRKKNAKRKHSAYENLKLQLNRNRIETTFSTITSLMPRCIRASTSKGFFLKIFFFILAFSIQKILPAS